MGNEQVVHNRVRRTNEEDAVFIIPTSTRLSPAQLAQLQAAGQQVGVPFVISEAGASRPSLNHIRKRCIQNLVALKRDSLKLKEMPDGKFSINFTYDAMVPAKASIYIKARDISGSHPTSLMIDMANVTWGPISLPQGSDASWSSADAGLLVTWSHLVESHHRHSKNKENSHVGQFYHVIIHLSPDSIGTSAAGASAARVLTTCNGGPAAGTAHAGSDANSKLNSRHETKRSFMSALTGAMSIVSSKTITIAVQKSGDEDDHIEATWRSSPSSSPAKYEEVVQSSSEAHTSSKTCTSESAGVAGLSPRRLSINLSEEEEGAGEEDGPSPPQQLINTCSTTESHADDAVEVSCANSTTSLSPGHNTASVSKGSAWLAASVPEMRGWMGRATGSAHGRGSGSDTRGNLHNCIRSEITYASLQSTQTASSGSPKKRAVSPQSLSTDLRCMLQRVDVNGSIFTTHEIFGFDEKKSLIAERETKMDEPGTDQSDRNAKQSTECEIADCVICLSEQRSVLVYPCRHLCLCADCAEALPSQSSKCPMCRNPAKLLLRIMPAKAV